MRFAFVVNNYPPRVGGVEAHVHSLATALLAAGHDVLVVTLGEPFGGRTEDGIRVLRLRERLRVGDVLGFPPVGSTRRITRLLRDERIDVVSVHTRFFPMSRVGVAAAMRAGVPVIHTEHGSGHVVSQSAVISLASRFVDLTVGRWVLRRADEVVGVSENVVAFVKRLSGRDARVFYNAITPTTSSHSDETIAAERAVFVGRLVPGKGADSFVSAVDVLRRRGHGITAEMLGDGPDRERTAAQIADLGLEDVVRLRGRVSAGEVRRALAGAVLVNPTILAEGFQTTLLEALDEGGRVVTFDVPGARLLRSQGHAVTIVDMHTPEALADAVLTALQPRSPGPALEGWYWPDRAREFLELAEGLRSRGAQGATR